MTATDLTVIINGHHEGMLAHHTLRALHRSLAFAAGEGLRVELIAVLDNADEATRAVFEEAVREGGLLAGVVATARVLEVSVGDAGVARNAGVEASASPFIGIIDADNLPSENWFAEAHRIAVAQAEPCVVHPDNLIIFQGRTQVWPQWPSDSHRFNAANFFDRTYWDCFCLAARDVFVAHPYAPTPRGSGFGPEDWHWNAQTVHAGVPHLSAPGTALFYRVKATGSLQDSHAEQRSLIHQTGLLTDPQRAAAVLPDARRAGRHRPGRRSPLLKRLVRETRKKNAGAGVHPLPPPPLGKTAEVMARLRPGFVDPAHYRFLYDLGDLSDVEATAHFRARAVEAPRGWLTAEELDALHPRTFRVDHYRALHHDVVHLKVPAAIRLHWLDVGRQQGRRARLTRAELDDLVRLDLDDYRELHADLTNHDDHQLVQHYLEWGRDEGRRSFLLPGDRSALLPVTLPEGLEAEWRAMHRVEPWVPIPTEAALRQFRYIGPPHDGSLTSGSAVWWQLVAALGGRRPDFVFFAPWLRMGGADLLLVRYAKAVAALRPDLHVVVVATHESSTHAELLGDTVTMVDLTTLAGYDDLDHDERARLTAVFLTQFRPAVAHIFNSPQAFDAVEHYARSMSAHTTLFMSTFVIDYGPEGEIYSALARRPVGYLDSVQRVIVDNYSLVEDFHEIYRMDRAKFSVHHQPVELPPKRPWGPRQDGAPLQVLWAARFDRQKRLDVLADVAEAATAAGVAVDWHVYGAPVIATADESKASISRLEELGARFHGTYRSFSELPLDDFDLFLLTSENEGIPLTLLDVLAHRLPVMAPLVGGIPELVSDTTGWPIERFDDVAAYVDALMQVAASRDEAERRADAGYALLAEDFSWEAFHRRLQETPGYLP